MDDGHTRSTLATDPPADIRRVEARPLLLFSATWARTALIFGLLLSTIALLLDVWTRGKYENVVFPLGNILALLSLGFATLPYFFVTASWLSRIGLAFQGAVAWWLFTSAVAIWIFFSQ